MPKRGDLGWTNITSGKMALSGQCEIQKSPQSELGHFEWGLDQKFGMTFEWKKLFEREVQNFGTHTCKLNGASKIKKGAIQRV